MNTKYLHLLKGSSCSKPIVHLYVKSNFQVFPPVLPTRTQRPFQRSLAQNKRTKGTGDGIILKKTGNGRNPPNQSISSLSPLFTRFFTSHPFGEGYVPKCGRNETANPRGAELLASVCKTGIVPPAMFQQLFLKNSGPAIDDVGSRVQKLQGVFFWILFGRSGSLRMTLTYQK